MTETSFDASDGPAVLLIIDNYDSFTYNLYQAVATLTQPIEVHRNDKITVDEVAKMRPQAIILSPGPGVPADAGICIDLIKQLGPQQPILGVCLGHQAMGEAYGGKVISAPSIVHGKSSQVFHRRQGLFKGLPLPLEAGRYHSLVVERESLPAELVVEADTPDGIIMGMRHQVYPVMGVQFHPESILTPHGPTLLENFLRLSQLLPDEPKSKAS